MRINTQAQYRLRRCKTWHPLNSLVRQDGKLVTRRIVCFKSSSAQLTCCVLAYWSPAFKDPWLIVTDLPPHHAITVWYGWRSWIEAGFKDFKRGGWRWEQSKMTRPERAERLWLVMSVATLWVLSVGGETDALASLPPPAVRPISRCLSCFVLGLTTIRASLDAHLPLPFGRFFPLYSSSPPPFVKYLPL